MALEIGVSGLISGDLKGDRMFRIGLLGLALLASWMFGARSGRRSTDARGHELADDRPDGRGRFDGLRDAAP